MVCRNGWLDVLREDFPDSVKPRGYWNSLKICRQEWRKYETPTLFQRGSPGAYAVASKRDWLKEMRKDFPDAKKRNYWNLETCRKNWIKYSSIKLFSRNCTGGYQAVLKNGWAAQMRNDFPKAIKSNSYWTLSRCREIWIQFSSISEFRNEHPSAYSHVSKKGWLKYLRKSFPSAKKRDYWTLKRCRAAWISCDSISDFSMKYAGAYDAVHKRGWITYLHRDLPISRKATANDTIYLWRSSLAFKSNEEMIIAKIGVTSARRGLLRIKSTAGKHKTSFEILRLIHNLKDAKSIEKTILKTVTPVPNLKGDGYKEFFLTDLNGLKKTLSLLDKLSKQQLLLLP